MNLRLYLVCFVSATMLLGGCATNNALKQAEPKPAAKPAPVFTDLASATVLQAVMGKKIELDFDDQTPRFDDGASPRPVFLVRLPPATAQLTAKVTTQREGTVTNPSIFYPEVRVLDANYRLVKVIPHQNYVYRGASSDGTLETTFYLNGPSANEHFLLVTNRDVSESDLKVSQTNRTDGSLIAPGLAFWMVFRGTSTTPTKMIADTKGEVEVTIAEHKVLTVK